MVELDILGKTVSVPDAAVARLRELAAAEAGRSNTARDLSLVLDRALKTGAHVALHRGEARALVDLLANHSDDAELAELAHTIQNAVSDSSREG